MSYVKPKYGTKTKTKFCYMDTDSLKCEIG